MFGTLMQFDNSLFDEFRRMERDLDELFGRWPQRAGIRSVVRGTFPAVNVGATPEKVDVYVFAAGVEPASLDISMQQNLLTITGKREAPAQENATYYRQERFNGEFRRVMALPDDVDPDRVEARYRNGIVHIAVSRRESAKPRQITVQ